MSNKQTCYVRHVVLDVYYKVCNKRCAPFFMRCVIKKCLLYTDSVGPRRWSNCRCLSYCLPRKPLGLSSFEIASNKLDTILCILCFRLHYFAEYAWWLDHTKRFYCFLLFAVLVMLIVLAFFCSLSMSAFNGLCLLFSSLSLVSFLFATCCPFCTCTAVSCSLLSRSNVRKDIDTRSMISYDQYLDIQVHGSLHGSAQTFFFLV